MITEAMVMKGLATVGAYTIGRKVIVPVCYTAGRFMGHYTGKLVRQLTKKGQKTTGKEKEETNQVVTEQAIMALLAECDKELAENEQETALTIVSKEKPEPKFDQHMQDWIRRIQEQYGGFANVALE